MSRGSRLALLHAFGASILLLAYVPFFVALVGVSTKNPYAGHVVFVPVFAAVVLWFDRHALQRLAGGRTVSGIGLTSIGLVLLGTGYASGNVSIQAVSLGVTTAGLGLYGFGVDGLRRMRFPLAFLLLTIPPPAPIISAMAPTVQRFDAAFAAVFLELLGIPLEQDGILLRLPGLTLEVAEECAGLRFLPILFVFVAAFARVVLPTASGQLKLMALSIPVAVLANAVRVTVMSVGVYVIGPSMVTGPLHYYTGKSLWALAFLTMVAFAWVLRARTVGMEGRRGARAIVADVR